MRTEKTTTPLLGYIEEHDDIITKMVMTTVPTDVFDEEQWQVTADLCAKHFTSLGLCTKLIKHFQCPWFIQVIVNSGEDASRMARLSAPRCKVLFAAKNEEHTIVLVVPVASNLVVPKKPKK